MSDSAAADTAFRVVDRLRGTLEDPWDVFGERLVTHEVHLVGDRVEMVRGPIRVEGYGIRVLRPAEDETGVGFVPSTDLTDGGVARVRDEAERSSRYARFPTRAVSLPGGSSASIPEVDAADPELWSRPAELLEELSGELLASFDGRRGVVPSFGSIKATLAEETLANSAGLERSFRRTTVTFEFAIKAFGGPEGAAPGEYWTIRESSGIPKVGLLREVEEWCRQAEDIRHAKEPPSGPTTVVFPPSVLAEVVPAIIGFRLSGGARLRDMMPAVGTQVGSELVTLWDDGLAPNGLGSGPCDDEGVVHARQKLVDRGVVSGGMYDILHGKLYDVPPTGHGHRHPPLFGNGPRYLHPPDPFPTNLVLEPGTGGDREELIEQVGEGLWVEQLGYAFPDPLSGHFGGEIRLAYHISGGKLTDPVRGGTVGGALISGPGTPSVLNSISGVGAHPSSVGRLRAPPVIVRGITVAGSK